MEKNVEIYIKEIGLKSGHFIHLAYDTDKGVLL
jgi:hypothetical protein